jgi:hypothetical protein
VPATQLLSIRIDSATAERLREQSESGEKSALAKRYIEEGLRMDRHPGIVFRPGPAGRRPAVEGGQDVWSLIRVVKNVPETGEAAVRAAAEWSQVPLRQVEAAVGYYAEHREEIDEFLDEMDRFAAEEEAKWRRSRDALS